MLRLKPNDLYLQTGFIYYFLTWRFHWKE